MGRHLGALAPQAACGLAREPRAAPCGPGPEARAWRLGPSSAPASRRGEGARQRRRQICAARAEQQQQQAAAPRLAAVDVDEELWSVLDICTDQELEHVHDILHGGSLMSPVMKSLVADSEPAAVHLRGRRSLMRRIEQRFRFLAADSGAMLRGRRPSYRETLLAARDRLQVACPGGLATQDLESEIFLHLLQRQAQAAQESAASLDAAAGQLRRRKRGPADALREKWAEAVGSLQLGAPEMGESAVKFVSALGVAGARKAALRQLGQQLLLQRARYQAALGVVCRGGAPVLQREATLKAAQAGLTSAAARYGTARGALSMLGPLMWGWLAADLALQSIGTDWQRLTRAIYALAQVRLLRTHGFIAAADAHLADP